MRTVLARGRIIDDDTKQPISGVKVMAVGSKDKFTVRKSNYHIFLGHTETGVDGKYEFEYVYPEGRFLTGITFEKAGYHEYDIAYTPVKTWESEEGEEYTLEPYNWLKVHIKNQNPINGEDSLMIYQWFSSDFFYLKGINIDTVVYFKSITREGHNMTWEVYKGGNKITYFDHRVCARLDTCEYEINY